MCSVFHVPQHKLHWKDVRDRGFHTLRILCNVRCSPQESWLTPGRWHPLAPWGWHQKDSGGDSCRTTRHRSLADSFSSPKRHAQFVWKISLPQWAGEWHRWDILRSNGYIPGGNIRARMIALAASGVLSRQRDEALGWDKRRHTTGRQCSVVRNAVHWTILAARCVWHDLVSPCPL